MAALEIGPRGRTMMLDRSCRFVRLAALATCAVVFSRSSAAQTNGTIARADSGAAPNERDVAIGRARLLSRAGRGRDAQDVLAAWTARHPNDGEAWDALGREQLRSGRPSAAAASFAQAQAAGFDRGVADRLRAARSQSAPALEPIAGYQRDSDGIATLRSGLTADFMVADGARLGATVVRGAVRDAAQSVGYTDATLRLSARPSRELRLNAEGGFAGFGAAPSSAAWTAPHGDFRLRWRAPNAVAWELRAQHQPLAAAPLLIANQVTRSDVRAMLQLPMGPMRLRGSTRAGLIHSLAVDSMPGTPVPTPGDTTRGRGPGQPGIPLPNPGGNARSAREPANRRLDLGAVLALPLGGVELSVGTHRVTYARASLAGYFAPRLAETIEGGAYLDLGSDGPVTFSADLGAGIQRTALQGESAGVWKPALRAWTYSSVIIAPGRALWFEIEAYDAPFSPHGVSAPSWRYFSLSSGLRWAVR